MMKLKLRVKVRNPKGKVISKHTFKGHSFLRNFLRMVGGFCAADIPVDDWTIIRYGGALEPAGLGADDQANVATSLVWILIGSGDTAPTILDDSLDAYVSYGAAISSQEDEDDPNYSIKWAVAIQNTSGAPWAIKEYMLRVRATWGNTSTDFPLLRDVPGYTIDVPDGHFIEVEYELITTV